MYLTFYKLKVKPFQITCDPRFLWLGDKHQEALAMLRYGISDNRGFLLLTGEVGTGKTLLINRLMTLLPSDAVVAKLSDPALKVMDFYRMLADGFDINQPSNSKAEFLIQLRRFLRDKAAKDQQVLLIMDEAHQLDHQLLEIIRTLSNIELHDRKLIDIFFVGQPELNRLLMREENRALAQRFTLRHHIEPLNQKETADYIHHRLTVAGGRKKIFNDSAIEKVFDYSGGIPRLINIISDHALLTGYIQNSGTIEAATVTECAQELHIPTRQQTIPNIRSAAAPHTETSAADAFSEEKPTRHPEPAQTASMAVLSMKRHPKPPWMAKWLYTGIVAFIMIFWALVLINFSGKSIPNQVEQALIQKRDSLPDEAIPALAAADKDITLRINATYATEEIDLTPAKKTDAPIQDPAPRVEPPAPQSNWQDRHQAKPPLQPMEPLPSGPAKAIIAAVVDAPAPAESSQVSDEAESSPKVRQMPPLEEENPVKKSVQLGWPDKRNIRIEIGKTNQIADQSLAAMDSVAADLIEFPERLIYVHGHADEADSIAHRQMILRQMVNAVKSYLTGKGAYPYQVKVVAKDDHQTEALIQGTSGRYAVIEFPQNHHFTDYNPDK